MLNLAEITKRIHHHGYARGVVVMDPSDLDDLLNEIETLRSRLADLQEASVAGLRRAKTEELVGKYFRARDPRRMIRVVDTLGADSFLVAFHHPDGRKMYSNEELTYAEMAKQYDLDRPVTPGANR